MKLHIGSGPARLEGWTNIDNRPYPGVDLVLDVTAGLTFANVEYIFAEHFLEHLPLLIGLRFLRNCREVLAKSGVLRIATPNLDWVWLTHYRNPTTLSGEEALVGCLEINRAFHGWGHRFLYNPSLLTAALESAGFGSVEYCSYGQSSREALRGLEQHPRSPDHPESPHLLVVEASGRSAGPSRLIEIAEPYLRDFSVQ